MNAIDLKNNNHSPQEKLNHAKNKIAVKAGVAMTMSDDSETADNGRALIQNTLEKSRKENELRKMVSNE